MLASSSPITVGLIIVSPYLKLVYAFIVGMIGSAAYVTALYFKFIGETDDTRRIVMGPFLKFKNGKDGLFRSSMSVWKCIWYCGMGGCIAVIFQFDVPNFVSVQSLILGVTWPAIVSQFLSGRMVYPNKGELEKLERFSTTTIHTPDLVKRAKEIEDEIKKQ